MHLSKLSCIFQKIFIFVVGEKSLPQTLQGLSCLLPHSMGVSLTTTPFAALPRAPNFSACGGKGLSLEIVRDPQESDTLLSQQEEKKCHCVRWSERIQLVFHQVTVLSSQPEEQTRNLNDPLPTISSERPSSPKVVVSSLPSHPPQSMPHWQCLSEVCD